MNKVKREYLVFLTVLTPDYLSLVINSLMSRNYTVTSPNSDKLSALTSQKLLSTLITLRLHTETVENASLAITEVYNDVYNSLNENLALYYSLVVVSGENTGALYNCGNIEVQSTIPDDAVMN